MKQIYIIWHNFKALTRKATAVSALTLVFMIFTVYNVQAQDISKDGKSTSKLWNKTNVYGIDIGCWLLKTADTTDIADWLERTYVDPSDGVTKNIYEPVNIIFLDGMATSSVNAEDRIRTALDQAGFPAKDCHSNGYYGYVGGLFRSMEPDESCFCPPSNGVAYADAHATLDNNHGRTFSSFNSDGIFFSAAAFSREKGLAINPGEIHDYISFNTARNAVYNDLNGNTGPNCFNAGSSVYMRNDYVTSSVFTGDHDGNAYIVVATDSYENDDTWQTAKAISGTQVHSISNIGDKDYVKFIVSYSQQVTIETNGPASYYYDTYLTLYDNTGTTVVAYDNDGGYNKYSKIVKALSPGTYYLKVDEHGNNSIIPRYTLSVSYDQVQILTDAVVTSSTLDIIPGITTYKDFNIGREAEFKIADKTLKVAFNIKGKSRLSPFDVNYEIVNIGFDIYAIAAILEHDKNNGFTGSIKTKGCGITTEIRESGNDMIVEWTSPFDRMTFKHTPVNRSFCFSHCEAALHFLGYGEYVIPDMIEEGYFLIYESPADAYSYERARDGKFGSILSNKNICYNYRAAFSDACFILKKEDIPEWAATIEAHERGIMRLYDGCVTGVEDNKIDDAEVAVAYQDYLNVKADAESLGIWNDPVNAGGWESSITFGEVCYKIYDIVNDLLVYSHVVVDMPVTLRRLSDGSQEIIINYIPDISPMPTPVGTKLIPGGSTDNGTRVFIEKDQVYNDGTITDGQTSNKMLPRNLYWSREKCEDFNTTVDIKEVFINPDDVRDVKIYFTMPEDYDYNNINNGEVVFIQQVRIKDLTWGIPGAGYDDMNWCEFNYGNYHHYTPSNHNGGGVMLTSENNWVNLYNVKYYKDENYPNKPHTKPTVLLKGHKYSFEVRYQIRKAESDPSGSWYEIVNTARTVKFNGYTGGNPISSMITFGAMGKNNGDKGSSTWYYWYNLSPSIGLTNLSDGFSREWFGPKGRQNSKGSTERLVEMKSRTSSTGPWIMSYRTGSKHNGDCALGYGGPGTELDLIETSSYYMPVKWHREFTSVHDYTTPTGWVGYKMANLPGADQMWGETDMVTVSDLTAQPDVPDAGKVTLTWRNPDMPDFSRVIIVRSNSMILWEPESGNGALYQVGDIVEPGVTVVYRGTGETYTDNGGKANYHYKVFVMLSPLAKYTPGVSVSSSPLDVFTLTLPARGNNISLPVLPVAEEDRTLEAIFGDRVLSTFDKELGRWVFPDKTDILEPYTGYYYFNYTGTSANISLEGKAVEPKPLYDLFSYDCDVGWNYFGVGCTRVNYSASYKDLEVLRFSSGPQTWVRMKANEVFEPGNAYWYNKLSTKEPSWFEGFGEAVAWETTQAALNSGKGDKGPDVTKMEFYVDGNLVHTNTSAPFEEHEFNPANYEEGWHMLTSKCHYTDGSVLETEPVPVQALTKGCAAKYKMDENGGFIVKDETGNNDGTLPYGHQPTWTTGKSGSGLSFDGSNDYVSVSNGSGLDLSDGKFTIEAWIYFPSSFSGYRGIIGHQGANGSPGRYPCMYIKNGSHVHFGFGDGSNWQAHTVENLVTAGNWYHLAYTLDSDNDVEKLYVNGAEKWSNTETHVPTNKTCVNIGYIDNYWQGKIDEVAIYDRALRPDEIAEHANLVGDTPIAQLHMDEGTGDIAYDATPNNNNGKLTNMNTSTCWVDGKAGKALSFSDSNDRVKLPHNAINGLDDLTFMCWIKTADVNTAGIITGAQSSSINNEFLIFLDATGKVCPYIKNSNITSTIDVNDGEWHHLAVTRSGSTVKVYKDAGTPYEWTSAPTGALSIAENGLWLASEQDAVGGGWDANQQLYGLLDEVAIFDRALSAEEISEHAGNTGGTGEYPWSDNEYGTLKTNVNWDYTMGYHFTPQVDGNVTQLGGFFNGTKTVKLWNKSTGVELASASVTSSDSWSYADINSVPVQAGVTYTVAAYSDGSGLTYRSGISLPQTYKNIKIEISAYCSGNGMPTTNASSNYMYGQADICFIAGSGSENDPPNANIVSISPSPANYGTNISFNGSSSDSDGYVTAYEWSSSLNGVFGTSEDCNYSELTVGSHTISFKVKDNDGAWSSPVNVSLTINGGDISPPLNVTSFTSEAGEGWVLLNWVNPVSDFYRTKILRKTGGYPVNHTDGNAVVVYDNSGTTYTDNGLNTDGTIYYYTAYAYDASGNYASGIWAPPAIPNDFEGPADVTGFSASVDGTIITLTWTNPTDADWAGTRIMCDDDFNGTYPEDPYDGIFIYNGTGTSVTHDIGYGTTGWYKIFTYDDAEDPNFSDGVELSATTEEYVWPVGQMEGIEPHPADEGETVYFYGDDTPGILEHMWCFRDGECFGYEKDVTKSDIPPGDHMIYYYVGNGHTWSYPSMFDLTVCNGSCDGLGDIPYETHFDDVGGWSEVKDGYTDFFWHFTTKPNTQITESFVISRAVTPALNTAGITSLDLSFWHYYNADVDAYGDVLKVQSSTDKVNWTDEAWVLPIVEGMDFDLILGKDPVNTTVTHNLGNKTYIALTLISGGDNVTGERWEIDDVYISEPGEETGLIANLHMDEGTGDTAYDATPNNNNGTLVNGATWVDGKIGKGINCDSGSERIDVNIDIDNTWTIESWFKSPVAGKGSTWSTLTRGDQGDHQILVRNDGYLGQYENSGAGFYSTGYDMDVLSAGWHHIAAAAESGVTKYYIDGQYVGSVNYVSSKNISWIGNYSSNQPFGTIDEVAIYNYALTPEEIAEHAGGCIEYSDDFNDNSINSSMWSTHTRTNGQLAETGNEITYYSSGNSPYNGANLYTKETFNKSDVITITYSIRKPAAPNSWGHGMYISMFNESQVSWATGYYDFPSPMANIGASVGRNVSCDARVRTTLHGDGTYSRELLSGTFDGCNITEQSISGWDNINEPFVIDFNFFSYYQNYYVYLDDVEIIVCGEDVQENNPPNANIVSISPSPANYGTNVSFNGSSSDSDGSVTAYEWSSSLNGVFGTSEDCNYSELTAGTHTISFKVKDNDGAWSSAYNASLTINSVDITPPLNVTNFTSEVGEGWVILNWVNPVSDFYRTKILRKTGGYPVNHNDGSAVVVYNNSGTTYTDNGLLTDGTIYYYKAYAYDASDNYASGTVAPPAIPKDVTAPADVTDFSADPDIYSVALSWTNPTDADWAGTRIMCGDDGGYPDGPYDGRFIYNSTGTSFTDNNVNEGTTYRYKAFTYDDAGEPNFSEGVELSVTTDDYVRPVAEMEGIEPHPADEGETVYFYGDDSPGIVDHLWCEVGGVGCFGYSKDVTKSDFSPGEHDIRYYVSYDGINWSYPSIFLLTVCNGSCNGLGSIPYETHFDEVGGWSEVKDGYTDFFWYFTYEANTQITEDFVISRAVTPELITTGMTSLDLNFWHYYNADVDAYGDVLRIQSSTDKVNWTNEAWVLPIVEGMDFDLILGREPVNTTITHNLGNKTYIAWTLVSGGSSVTGENWRIDDVYITEPGKGATGPGDGTTGIDDVLQESKLYVYPNPMTNEVTIYYGIQSPAVVTIGVYDITGRLVRTLTSEYKSAGRHTTQWKADNTKGSLMPEGIYFIRMQNDDNVQISKVVLER